MISNSLLSCHLPCVMWMLAGMLPRRSSNVCIFTPPLLYFPKAYVASLMLVDMVVESRAYSNQKIKDRSETLINKGIYEV